MKDNIIMIIKGKRGIELSMNVVIIAIIVLLVLVLVVIFFTGAMANIVTQIKNIFFTQTVDVSRAVLSCNGYCNQYDATKSAAFRNNFCDKSFNLDVDGDGVVDEKGEKCYGRILNVQCPSIDNSDNPCGS